MAIWRKRQADRPSLVVASLGGREDLLPDYTYPLGDDTEVVGRGDAASIQILDEHISRQHFQIRHDPAANAYLISDLKSVNGTMLNGVKLGGETTLREADLIEIGGSRLIFTWKRFKDNATALRYMRIKGQRIKGTMVKGSDEQ